MKGALIKWPYFQTVNDRIIITNKFGSARIEIQGSGQSESGGQFRGGDETVSGGVGVVTSGKVTVVRCDDGVLVAFLDVLAIPLTDARSAGVGQNGSAELAKCLGDAVAFDGGADLFGSRGDVEGRLGFQPVVQGFAGDTGAATHVFVAGVGAATNQRYLRFEFI